MDLTPVQKKFILHWGEMGEKWGVNRTIAQVHALLYVSPRPLNAEEIAATLSVARSNVSNSLRELQGWGIIRVTHQMGDRKDYFESMKDVWEMFRVVMDERKKRECDPTQALLRQLVAEAGKEDPYTRERMEKMLEFFDMMGGWYEQMRRLPTGSLLKLLKMGDKVAKLIGVGRG